MNEKRDKFREKLAVASTNNRNEEKIIREPTIGEIADGYKNFINDLGGGFLEFIEAYNQCIQIAKKNKLIKNVSLTARIKDFSSSLKNTEVKLLDDVFGIQLVTGPKITKKKKELTDIEKKEADIEKEILILFNCLMMDIQNHKIYNKENGYFAYHCTSDFKLNTQNLEKRIIELVENMEAREYKYAKNEPQYEKDKMAKVFPNLIEKIKEPMQLNLIVYTLQQMLELLELVQIKMQETPLIEFHFMRSDVEENSISGEASHSRYKKVQTKLVRQFFNDGRMFRGINIPLKFEADENGVHMIDVYDIILKEWSFLEANIEDRRNKGKENIDKERNYRFDVLLASQFTFLRKYIGMDDSQFPEKYKQEKWGVLKGIWIANRIDFSREFEQDIGKTVFEGIQEMW